MEKRYSIWTALVVFGITAACSALLFLTWVIREIAVGNQSEQAFNSNGTGLIILIALIGGGISSIIGLVRKG